MEVSAATRRPGNSRQGGFTLIELLVVLGILTGFLAMLIQFVDSGVRLFDEGESGQALADRAEAARAAVERELRAISADTRKLDGGLPDDRFLVQRLGLGLPSRGAPSEEQAFVLRAGVALSPAVELRLQEDAILLQAALELGEAAEPAALMERAGQLQAASGLRGRGRILLAQWPEGSDGALVELRIGRFLLDQTIALDQDRMVDPFLVPIPGSADLPSLAIHAHTETLVRGLLYANVEMWSQSTRAWSGTGEAGPELVWDSARAGWLVDPTGDETWRFDRDESSLELPADDIHPRAMRVTLVVAADEQRPKEGLLSQAVEADSKILDLVNGDRFPGSTDGGWCKVGSEWIEYAQRVGDELRGCRRGQRGTRAKPHSAASVVRVGRTVQFTIPFAHAKDDWNG